MINQERGSGLSAERPAVFLLSFSNKLKNIMSYEKKCFHNFTSIKTLKSDNYSIFI